MSGLARFEVRVEVRRGALRVAAWAGSDELDRIALVVDFRRLRALLEEVLDRRPANDPPELARWLLDTLRAEVAGEPYAIDAVEVGTEEGMSFILQADTPEAPRPADLHTE